MIDELLRELGRIAVPLIDAGLIEAVTDGHELWFRLTGRGRAAGAPSERRKPSRRSGAGSVRHDRAALH
jgi:hypothetical protein